MPDQNEKRLNDLIAKLNELKSAMNSTAQTAATSSQSITTSMETNLAVAEQVIRTHVQKINAEYAKLIDPTKLQKVAQQLAAGEIDAGNRRQVITGKSATRMNQIIKDYEEGLRLAQAQLQAQAMGAGDDPYMTGQINYQNRLAKLKLSAQGINKIVEDVNKLGIAFNNLSTPKLEGVNKEISRLTFSFKEGGTTGKFAYNVNNITGEITNLGQQTKKTSDNLLSMEKVIRALPQGAGIKAYDLAKQYGFAPETLQSARKEGSTGTTTLTFAYRDQNQVLQKLNITTTKFGDVLVDTQRRFRSFGQTIVADVWKVLQWSIAIGAVYGPLYKIEEAMQNTVENEQRLADASVVLAGAQQSTNDVLSASVKIARDTGETLEGVIEGFNMAYRATGNISDSTQRFLTTEKFLNDAIILAKLSTLDQAGATDTLSAALKQSERQLMQLKNATTGEALFKDPLEAGTYMLDLWIRTTQVANVDLTTLATGFAVVGDAADASAISIEELSAALAVVAESGLASGEEAANTARALISGFESDKAVKAMEKYGIALKKANGEQTNFIERSKEIYTRYTLGILSPEAYSELTSAIGGGTRRKAAVSAFIGQYPRIGEIMQGQQEQSVTAEEALAKQTDTLQTSFKNLGTALSNFTMTMGESGGALDTMKIFTKIITEAVDGLNLLIGGMGKAGNIFLAMGIGTAVLRSQSAAKRSSLYAGMGGIGESLFNTLAFPFFNKPTGLTGVSEPQVRTGGYYVTNGGMIKTGAPTGTGSFSSRFGNLQVADSFILSSAGVPGGPLDNPFIKTRREQIGGNISQWIQKNPQVIFGAMGTLMPAISNLSAGNLGGMAGNLVGGGLGAGAGVAIGSAIVGSLSTGGVAIGAIIGSAIGEAFVKNVMQYQPQFENFFKLEYKGPGAAGKEKPEEQTPQEKATQKIYEMAGGGNETRGRLLSWIGNIIGTIPFEAVKMGSKNVKGTLTQETVAATLAGIFGDKEQVARLLKEGQNYQETGTTRSGIESTGFQGKVAEVVKRDNQTIANVIKKAQDDLLQRLIKQEITPTQYTTDLENVGALSSKATEWMTAFGDSLKGTVPGIEDFTDAYEAFAELTTTASEDVVQWLDVTANKIAELSEQGLPVDDLKRQAAEYLKFALEASRQAKQIKFPTFVVNETYDKAQFNLIKQRALEIAKAEQDAVVKSGQLTQDDIDKMIQSWQPFFVQLKEGFEEVFGLTTDYWTRAVTDLQKTGTIPTETVKTPNPLQQWNISQAQMPDFEAAYQNLYKQLKPYIDAKQIPFEPEDFVAMLTDGFTVQHKDLTLANLALQKLIEIDQKQLDGIFNLPEGANIMVPLEAAKMYPQGNGSGIVTSEPLDKAGTNLNTAGDKLITAADKLAEKKDLLAQQPYMQNPGQILAEKKDMIAQEGYTTAPEKTYKPSPQQELKAWKWEMAQEGFGDYGLENPDWVERRAMNNPEYSTGLDAVEQAFNSAIQGFIDSLNSAKDSLVTLPDKINQLLTGNTEGIVNKNKVPQFQNIAYQTAGATPTPVQVSSKINLNLVSKVDLIVDGAVLARVIKPYLSETLTAQQSTLSSASNLNYLG